MAIVWSDQLRFVLALGLSALVGLERERSRAHGNPHAAGVRTHMLTAIFGFACAEAQKYGVPGVFLVGLGVIGLVQVSSFWRRTVNGLSGWTSELSVLVSFAVGASLPVVDVWIPTAAAIVGAIVLNEKARIEHYVEKLDSAEFLGVLKFLLVTCIVLPMLPDRGFTTWDINPASTWKIVVMVSSVGFVGYFLVRQLGGKVGLWVSGLVGGVVSSTAVSVAMGRLAAKDPAKGGAALQAALLASSVMYLRILVLVWIVHPQYGLALAWKLPLLSLAGILLAATVPAAKSPQEGVGNLQNPFEIMPALGFAIVFTLFSVGTMVVRSFMGSSGLVLLALVVGAVDIDPFILSVARNSAVEHVLLASILMAMLSNTVAKGVYFGTLAGPQRRQAFLRYFGWAFLHIPLALL